MEEHEMKRAGACARVIHLDELDHNPSISGAPILMRTPTAARASGIRRQLLDRTGQCARDRARFRAERRRGAVRRSARPGELCGRREAMASASAAVAS